MSATRVLSQSQSGSQPARVASRAGPGRRGRRPLGRYARAAGVAAAPAIRHVRIAGQSGHDRALRRPAPVRARAWGCPHARGVTLRREPFRWPRRPPRARWLPRGGRRARGEQRRSGCPSSGEPGRAASRGAGGRWLRHRPGRQRRGWRWGRQRRASRSAHAGLKLRRRHDDGGCSRRDRQPRPVAVHRPASAAGVPADRRCSPRGRGQGARRRQGPRPEPRAEGARAAAAAARKTPLRHLPRGPRAARVPPPGALCAGCGGGSTQPPRPHRRPVGARPRAVPPRPRRSAGAGVPARRARQAEIPPAARRQREP